MKRLLCIAILAALAGCLPTDPTTTEQYPAPQMRSVGAPMGGENDCVLTSVPPGYPTVVTDSGAHCPKTNSRAQVLEWRWRRDRNGTCSVVITHARRTYGCIDVDPI